MERRNEGKTLGQTRNREDEAEYNAPVHLRLAPRAGGRGGAAPTCIECARSKSPADLKVLLLAEPCVSSSIEMPRVALSSVARRKAIMTTAMQ